MTNQVRILPGETDRQEHNLFLFLSQQHFEFDQHKRDEQQAQPWPQRLTFNILSTLLKDVEGSMEKDQLAMCHSLKIKPVVTQHHFAALFFLLPASEHKQSDKAHITMQKQRRRLVVTVFLNLILMDFFPLLFLAYVSLTEHKIRDFIARQLVSAQRWGGCSVFTVRYLLLVGVKSLRKRTDKSR